MNFSKIEFKEGNDVYFEPKSILAQGGVIGKSVHDVNATSKYYNVVNIMNYAIVLKAGTRVGEMFASEIAPEPPPQEEQKQLNEAGNGHKDILTLKLGETLTSTEKKKLQALLAEYHECFQWNFDSIGHTMLVTHSIPTGDHRPIVQKQYPIPTVAQESMRNQVKDLLDKGFIRESNSSWRSPILLIKKILADGTIQYRFCIDLRKVNDITAKDAYSLPRIDETVNALSGSKFLSTMDIDRAFWQVALDEADKRKTAFVVDGQLYEFNVMPFGSMNEPATFQRLMDKVLRGLTWKQCLVYLDDVLVFAKTFEQHLDHLINVFERIKSSGLRLKPAKCCFATEKVEYLGFTISSKGIQPSRIKVEALLKIKPPATTKLLHSFLCSINFYRGLIPNYGHLTVELFDSTYFRVPGFFKAFLSTM